MGVEAQLTYCAFLQRHHHPSCTSKYNPFGNYACCLGSYLGSRSDESKLHVMRRHASMVPLSSVRASIYYKESGVGEILGEAPAPIRYSLLLIRCRLHTHLFFILLHIKYHRGSAKCCSVRRSLTAQEKKAHPTTVVVGCCFRSGGIKVCSGQAMESDSIPPRQNLPTYTSHDTI